MAPASDDKSIKKLRCIQRSVDRHWVGNGFPVRTLFAYPNLGAVLSPFLLLDYAGPAEVGLFDRAGRSICIDSAKDATALLLAGAPIDEPIVGHGPFVMNTAQEIRHAIADYQSGKMGHLA